MPRRLAPAGRHYKAGLEIGRGRAYGRPVRRVLAIALVGVVALPVALASAARAPKVAIQATFVQAEFKTTYAISARGTGSRTLTGIEWTFTKPPGEPTCTGFTSSGRGAVWLHGDQHGCSHEAMTARGPDGVVRVRFKLGSLTCRVTFRGTETGRTAGRCSR